MRIASPQFYRPLLISLFALSIGWAQPDPSSAASYGAVEDLAADYGRDRLDAHTSSVVVEASDSLALVALYELARGPQWAQNAGWLTAPVRFWYGVTVTDGRVTHISLPENRMGGAGSTSLPLEIGDLTFLQVLDLHGNSLLGDVPETITRLSHLEELYLNDNLLRSLPDLSGLGDQALRVVDVSGNRLTFDDLEPNAGQRFTFTYAPQGSFNLPVSPRSAYEGDAVTLAAGDGGAQSRFQWYLDGVALEGANASTYTISEATDANAGPYEVEVTNPLFPELVLRSDPKTLALYRRNELQWLDIGSYQNGYPVSGAHIDQGSGTVGMQYPAILRFSNHLRYSAFWVGVRDWTDDSGSNYPYYVARIGGSAGSRNGEAESPVPIEHRLIGRYADTVVEVDGVPSFDKNTVLDDVDPTLPADRMVHSVRNLSMGITVEQKAYAYTNEYNDNYHLIDYAYCNTGNIDEDEEVELPDQTLHDVYFFWSRAWRGAEQASRVTSNDQAWGRYTTYDVVGDGHEPYPVDFTAQYGWVGWGLGTSSYYELGGPVNFSDGEYIARNDTVGRLSAATMMGAETLHADRSTTDASYDRGQPSVMSFHQNDGPYNHDGLTHEDYYRLGILGPTLSPEEAECIPCRRVYPHFADQNQPDGTFWTLTDATRLTGLQAGGHAATAGYGPYEMAPGECVNITVAEGVAGLSFDAATRIGRAFKRGGSDRDTERIAYDADGDGRIDSTGFDYDQVFTGAEALTKNQWVMSARDSLFQAFNRAQAVFEASDGFSVYPMAEPPHPPSRFSLRSRPPDAIDLEWTPATDGPAVDRWELFRTEGWVDNLYGNGCLDDPSVACGYERVATLPADTRVYTDTDVSPDAAYYYYLQAVGKPQPESNDAISGTPGGVPLRSGRYLTQTYSPVSPAGPAVQPEPLPEGIGQLAQFPNPFLDQTTIRYIIPQTTTVKLVVYDVLGREVERLVDGVQAAGLHEVVFHPGGVLASGVYFYTLEAGDLKETGKMVRLR
ncbi:MAG: T9SS type A sorting domain-containing protein [Rhodothermales bacterium]